MVLEGKKTSFALTVIASSLLIGCNSSGSDSKLGVKPDKQQPASEISGVALDGYLKNAKVCIDLNKNLTCDSSDGEVVVLTDSHGAYKLPKNDADLKQYNVVVEAIANQTVDMDSPAAPVQDGFALSAPATEAGVVSPLTTLTSIVADQHGISFTAARNMLASHLGVDKKRLTSDFLAGNHPQDRELHALAQGLTALMQEAEKASVSDGIFLRDARSGSRIKLGLMDVAKVKTETDKLVGTVNQTPDKIRETVKDFVADVTVTREEIEGNQLQVQPKAPQAGTLNSAARTFDWQWVGLLTSAEHYEYSVDAGKNWVQVENKPLHLGTKSYEAGDIQVRVKANHAKGMASGKVLLSDQPLAQAEVPVAPAAITIDDANNRFDWDLVPGYDNFADYEFTTGGGHWQAASSKPQSVGDVAIAAGALKVRVAADEAESRPEGLVAVSTSDFTTTLAKPEKPSNIRADDTTDSVDWGYVAGFDKFSDYEISLDNGKTWNEVTAKPLSVGNSDIEAGWVQLRVAPNTANGMQAGEIAKVNLKFNKKTDKPAAPSNLKVDDHWNELNWEYVDGFNESSHYEISLKGVSTNPSDWAPAGKKPAAVPDGNYGKGEVCLRVKANVVDGNVAGVAACSEAYFTAKPGTPTAPDIDDDNDTFGWTLVDGYPQLSSYQIKIEQGDWEEAKTNPHKLDDRAYAKDSIQVRVGPDAVTGREAGDALTNDIEFTKKPVVGEVTLLTAAGAVTQDRSQAACARMADGKVWQLFNSSNGGERFKTGPDIHTELGSFAACGVENWRMPTTAELQSLFTESQENPELSTFDNNTFAYMHVAKMVDEKTCYLSGEESSSSPGYTECLNVSTSEKPETVVVEKEVVKAQCSMMCGGPFGLKKILYRFIAQ